MKEELKFICEDFKIKAKRLIEINKKLSDLESNSSEYRIQHEVFTNILRELTTYAEIIYNGILSYSNEPTAFAKITNEDVLRLQLVQGEVTSMLNESEIYLQYAHPNHKKN